MVHYRRYKEAGGTIFFTVALRNRKSSILIDHIDLLREAMRHASLSMPYKTLAIVVLPDHLHAIWQLPDDDSNYSYRWMKIKSYFTRGLIKRGIKLYKNTRGEYYLWQRRFWEHLIRNEIDYENHVNYIHYNPVKHGLVQRVQDWKYSSFHQYVKNKIYPLNWSDNEDGNWKVADVET